MPEISIGFWRRPKRQQGHFAARLPKEIAKNAEAGYGNCSAKAQAVFSTARILVNDDLEKFHQRHMASDSHYAAARHLLELGEAVALLREEAKLTRAESGKRLRVKARDIALVEDETPLAPAGLLEAALSLLVQLSLTKAKQPAAVVQSIRTIRHFRPTLAPA